MNVIRQKQMTSNSILLQNFSFTCHEVMNPILAQVFVIASLDDKVQRRAGEVLEDGDIGA